MNSITVQGTPWWQAFLQWFGVPINDLILRLLHRTEHFLFQSSTGNYFFLPCVEVHMCELVGMNGLVDFLFFCFFLFFLFLFQSTCVNKSAFWNLSYLNWQVSGGQELWWLNLCFKFKSLCLRDLQNKIPLTFKLYLPKADNFLEC